ncbi:MAG: DUF116 domain-containing protein [Clostridia bacterium]|nr:DUF116 domain-containing protein [Clostridia bacterium]MDD4665058.1 DUF116 domain-containing protein [Clostridia bacterium]
MSSTIKKNKEAEQRAKKRIFVGLLLGSLLFLAAVVAFAWWLVSRQAFYLNKILLTVVIAVAIVFFVLLSVGLLGLIWSLWRSKEIAPLQSIMRTATRVLFPLAIWMGKWLGLAEEKIKSSYIQVSNQLVRTQTKLKAYQKVMLLAPHCLQWIHCPHKITINVDNCKRCGHCPIADLLDLAQKTGAHLEVVTGGTMARKVIKEYHPQAVVAIACERDLTSGIQDVEGLPVLGIVNERPEGPCANTRVDLSKVEEAIRGFRQETGISNER